MKGAPIRVLLVEDNPGDAYLVEDALARSGVSATTRHVERLGEACALAGEVDVVLLDLRLPDSEGPEAIEALQNAFAGVPVVVLSGMDDTEMALHALHVGAQDYLVKGRFDETFLGRTLQYALERFRLQRELRRHAEMLEANLHRVVDSVGDGLVIATANGDVLYANLNAQAQLGAALGGRFGHALVPGSTVDVPLRGDGIGEMRVVDTVWRGGPALLASVRDVTPQRRAQDQLRRLATELEAANRLLERLATHDALTDLLNRRGAERALDVEAARAERSGSPLAAILLDCDDFKAVNDRNGHGAGDQVLAQVARVLKSTVRPTDHVARLGGDEFLVLLPEATLPVARAIAERVREAVQADPVATDAGPVRVTCSVGVALLPAGASTLSDVLHATDDMLAASKRSGKNRVSSASG